jgi:hypothetical protein
MTVHTFDIVLDSIQGFKSTASINQNITPMKSVIYICPITHNQIILDSCVMKINIKNGEKASGICFFNI